jgi:transcriptional regulator with XRE-family HTH domain
MAEAPTAEELLARSIRFHRDRLRLTAKQLSERISELGGSISRQAISKIELADRDVRIDELLYLARALNTSPLQLLFPPGQPEERIPAEVQVAGATVDVWAAARWFSGESSHTPDRADATWGVPLYLFRQHEHYLRLSEAQASTGDGRDGVDELLRYNRAEMRRHGLTPPELPEELKYLDQPTGTARVLGTGSVAAAGQVIRREDD